MTTDSQGSVTLEVRQPDDAGWCRALAKKLALEIGFTSTQATELAIVVSELAVNVAKHGGGGTITLRHLTEPPGIEVEARDEGPGIDNVPLALEDGVSQGNRVDAIDTFNPSKRKSLGYGLGAVTRLSDYSCIESGVGKGTTVVARKWLKRR
jgi:serine/threonine-protein kinase RsbT